MHSDDMIPMYPTIEVTLEIMRAAYVTCTHDMFMTFGDVPQLELLDCLEIMSSAITLMDRKTDEATAEIIWNAFTESYGKFWLEFAWQEFDRLNQVPLLLTELEAEEEEDEYENEDEALIFFDFSIDEGEGSMKNDNLVVMSIPEKRELLAHESDID